MSNESVGGSSLRYRPAIDGLRAIAVGSVLVFHLNAHWLPGGFVGVDVFFVVSGFLITSMIVGEVAAGHFSLLRFFQRRIARIFPHSALVCGISLLASCFVYGPGELGAVGAATVASALSAANVKFAFQGNYFEFPEDIQPLLHYWSLGVEEQFYLLWPLLLLFVARGRGGGWALVAFLACLSFAACVFQTAHHPNWAFYLLPFRAWELFVGCLLAIAQTQRVSRSVHIVGQWIGLALIALSVAFVRPEGFPGWFAAVPVIGTGLVIGFGVGQGGAVERLLALPLLVWIGRLSFSLYLWHWPVFCLLDYRLFTAEQPILLTVKVGAALVLSLLGYFLFERPLRKWLSRDDRRKVALAVFFGGVLLLAGAGAWVRASNYSSIIVAGDEVSRGGYEVRTEGSRGRVSLFGDSHAGMYGRVVLEMCENLQMDCQVISVPGTDPLPDSPLWRDYIEMLKRSRPDFVVYVAFWGPDYGDIDGRVREAVRQLLRLSDGVVLVCRPPKLPHDDTRAWIRTHGYSAIHETAADRKAREIGNAAVRGLSDARVKVIEVDDLFMSERGEIALTDAEGNQNFWDRGHLTYHGSVAVKPRIRQALEELLAISRAGVSVP